ncbi:NXPE family member 3-like [Pseudophryne corroboree]|uniref:NXPE family member 3-like n=1 Tax=Pseudophryne corroboree TaxID=495146 RepID=UPI003081DB29
MEKIQIRVRLQTLKYLKKYKAPSPKRRTHHTNSSNTTFVSSTSADPNFKELLRLIDWPEPPSPVTHYNLSTSPGHCDYHLLNARDTYRIGETLEVLITARDHHGRPKEYGGDYFRAKLHSPALKAGVTGHVKDHGNGSYLATFLLPWPGRAEVQIRLIHSSEAVAVLKKKRENHPGKLYFYGYFQLNDSSEVTECNLVLPGRDVCKYQDPASGNTWQCVRPQKLPCESRVYHGTTLFRNVTSQLEDALLSGPVTDRIISGNVSPIKVLSASSSLGLAANLSACRPDQKSTQPSGFYYRDNWRSLTCLARQFQPSDALACLKGKDIYMIGDSTLRQWLEYLKDFIPSLMGIDLHVNTYTGPLLAVDAEAGLAIRWRFHGLPVRARKTLLSNIHYETTELAGIGGGPDTVVMLNLWAHFTTFPVRFYIQRLGRLRQAVASLLSRSPQTNVIIKSANTGPKTIYISDWLSLQLDTLMRATFKGMAVTILDVWDMTSCHYLPDDMHPGPEVIRNEVDLMLSYVCPQ